jgi:DNA-binding CsgD family transcriptional regulator
VIVQPLFLGWFHGIAAVVVAAAGARELVAGRDWVDIDDVYLTSSFAVARAIVAGRRGDRAAAEELFAAGDARLAGAPWVRALFRRHAGEAALSAGWGDPQRMLTEAHAFFAAAGNHDLARACAALSSRPSGPAGLTAREAEVLALVTTGMTNREIAQRLHLSPRTVEKHVDRLRAKTGTANRTELVAVVLRGARGAPAGGG